MDKNEKGNQQKDTKIAIETVNDTDTSEKTAQKSEASETEVNNDRTSSEEKDTKGSVLETNNTSVETSKEVNNKDSNNNWFSKLIDYSVEKRFFSKIFIICFAALVFSYVYKHQETITREALSYIGLILCVVVCYTELLGIRDHLWVIEGSLPASKRWREAFFNPTTIRKHKIRKMIVLLFAYVVFVGLYKVKFLFKYREALSSIGLIMMVTVVYYEVLAVRDEIDLISKMLKQYVLEQQSIEEQKDKNEKI